MQENSAKTRVQTPMLGNISNRDEVSFVHWLKSPCNPLALQKCPQLFNGESGHSWYLLEGARSKLVAVQLKALSHDDDSIYDCMPCHFEEYERMLATTQGWAFKH